MVHEGDGRVVLPGVVAAISAGPLRGQENSQLLRWAVAPAMGDTSMFVPQNFRCPTNDLRPGSTCVSVAPPGQSTPMPSTTPVPVVNGTNSSNSSNYTEPEAPLLCYYDEPQTCFENGSFYAQHARWHLCPSGELMFQLQPYVSGSVTLNITLSDDGGTERGGVDTSVTQLITVIVKAVNSQPSFSMPTSIQVDEDSGNYSQVQITDILRGPTADEDGQNVTFSATFVDGSADLFVPRRWRCPESNPADDGFVDLVALIICPGGRIMFEVAPDSVGAAIFNVSMQDSGGLEHPRSVDTSRVHTLTIDVVPVNDAPSFQIVQDVVSVVEGSGLHVVPGVAGSISRGSAEEGAQEIVFTVQLVTGSSLLFTQQPTLDAGGVLSFTLAPFRFGFAVLNATLTDNGGGQDSSQIRQFQIEVLAKNDAPQFDLVNRTNLLEDEANVSRAHFVFDVKANGAADAPVGDEGGQNVSFFLFVQSGSYLFEPIYNATDPALASPSALSALGEQGFLRIDTAANNTLVLKLSANRSGVARIAVVAKDDGGTDEDGEDLSEVRYADITVAPVNDAPSFELVGGDCLGRPCTETMATIVMERNSFLRGQDFVMRGFVKNISTGPPDESEQTLTFNVRKVSGDEILVRAPAIDGAGLLNVTQLKDTAGIAFYQINVTDSGGRELGGADTSVFRTARFITVGGSVTLRLTLNASMDAPDLRAQVAGFLDAWCVSSQLAWCSSLAYPRDLIVLEGADSAAVGTGNNRRLLSVTVSVTVLAPTGSTALLASMARVLEHNASSISGVSEVTSTVSLVDSTPTYQFSLSASEVLVVEDSPPYAEAMFVRNVTAGDAARIDTGGRQVVTFDVYYVGGLETTTGATGVEALFSSPPVVEWAPCAVSQADACGGTLRFALGPERFGTGDFMVFMRNASGTARALTIRVAPVNDMPSFAVVRPRIVLNETLGPALETLRIPGVVTNMTAGAGEDGLQSLSFNVTVIATSGALNWTAGMSVSALRNTSEVSSSSLHVFFESVLVDASDGSLQLRSKPDVFGIITLRLQLIDSDGSASNSSNVVIEILYVNHVPSFQVASDVVTILEDCGAATAVGACNGLSFTYDAFAYNMQAGRANEGAQRLTLQTDVTGCQVPFRPGGAWQSANMSSLVSQGCPRDSSFPSMQAGHERLFSQDIVVWNNGTLTLSLVPDRHGAVRLQITLSDHGGTERGGVQHFTLDVLLDVVSVNDAPSAIFGPGLLNITVNEGCRDYAPERPYPNGWTWVQDAEVCGVWRGVSFSGCWYPLYQCEYTAEWDDVSTAVNTSFCPASCSGSVVEGEVVLEGTSLSVLVAEQTTLKLAIVEAMKPIQVSLADVNVSSVSNITLPFAQPAERALLDEHSQPGVRLIFEVANVDLGKSGLASSPQSSCFQGCFNSSCNCVLPFCVQPCVSQALRSHMQAAYNGTLFPTTAVTRLHVVPASSGTSTQPAACVNPELPPRVQCMDGKFAVDGQISGISPGPWGEEDQQIWFTVDQTSQGGFLGELRVSLPLFNVTSEAVVTFEPVAQGYSVITYSVTVHDSGGDVYGMDATTYADVIQLQVLGFNRPPSFQLQPLLYVVQDASCIQVAPGGSCAASCQQGLDLCAGGALPGIECAGGSCPGNCSSGLYIPRSFSCSGTCSCDYLGNALCSAEGICFCDEANHGAVCFDDSECTGGGVCASRGSCVVVSDTGASCASDSDCSNRGVCVRDLLEYRRNELYGLARNISKGIDAESWQSASFQVTPDNETQARALFAVLPTLRENGVLDFNLTEGKFGSHSFTVMLRDSSGDPQTEFSDSRRFTIVVNPENSLPSFELPANITVMEDSPPYDNLIALDIFSPNAVGLSLAVSFEVRVADERLFLQKPFDPSTNASAVDGRPRLSDNGRLTFQLAPDVYGTTKLFVTMRDASRVDFGLVELSKETLVIVQPVNDAPSFVLSKPFVSSGVEAAQQRLQVLANISVGPPNELCRDVQSESCQEQKATFIVEDMSNPLLFLEFPSVDASTGELVYRLAKDTSGVSTVSLRLLDDGALNDAPAYAACANYEETGFRTLLTPDDGQPDGANAACLRDSGAFRGRNTSQLVTLVIQAVEGPPVEELRLLYSVNLTSVPNLQKLACPPLTTPYPANLDPAAVVDEQGLLIEGILGGAALLCSVLPGAAYDLGEGVPRPNALVMLAVDQGVTEISSFAAVIREGTYLGASLAAFRRPLDADGSLYSASGSEAAASLLFLDRRQSSRRATEGLEYSDALTASPDGLHVYALEPELDSISVWNIHQQGVPSWQYDGNATRIKPEYSDDSMSLQGWPEEDNVSFVERRAHMEQRIRLRGMDTGDALTFDRVSRETYTPDMPCHLEPFDNTFGNNQSLQVVGMAGGCMDPSFDHLLLQNDTHDYVRPNDEVKVLGRWDFSRSSLYGDHYVSPTALDAFGSLEWSDYYAPGARPTAWTCTNTRCQAAFEATGNVTCTPGRGCTYSRGSVQVPDCKEPAADVHIYPATVANTGEGGALGALVMTGPKCRSHATVHDWLLAPSPGYSLINFLVNDGKHEALQFDGLMNSGLFLTNDVRSLVDKDPTKTKLPTHEMSVEAWVTIDSQEAKTGYIMSAGISAPTCSKGWVLYYELRSTGSAQMQLNFKFGISLDSNDATGRGTMQTVDVNAPPASRDTGAEWTTACKDMGLPGATDSPEPRPCNPYAGQWFHVVASYDSVGMYLQIATVPDNFEKVDINDLEPMVWRVQKKACASPPCGAIIYESSFHPKDGEPTPECTTYGPVPVIVGNYTGRESRDNLPGAQSHIGLIKQVAVYRGALTEAQALQNMQVHRSLFYSRPHWQRYWGKATGISPSINFINAEDSGTAWAPNVTLHGLFLTKRYYRCRWSSRLPLDDVDYQPPPLHWDTVETLATPIPYQCAYGKGQQSCGAGTGLECDMPTCLDVPSSKMDEGDLTPDSISLTCPTPMWSQGMQEVVLTLAEGFVDPDPAGLFPNTIQWTTLWQKTCLSHLCGYTFYRTRLLWGSAHTWMFASIPDLTQHKNSKPCVPSNRTSDHWREACHKAGAMVLSSAVHGSVTHFTMAATSTLWTFDMQASASWRGQAPIDALELEASGQGYLAGSLVLSSSESPTDAASLDPNAFLARFENSPLDGGIVHVRVVSSGLGMLNASRFPSLPAAPSLRPRAIFPSGCATYESSTDPTTWCNRTVQDGRVTAITMRAGAKTTNCTEDGSLTVVNPAGENATVAYRVFSVVDKRIAPDFTFGTVGDRGSGFLPGQDVVMYSSDGRCLCLPPNGTSFTRDMSLCFEASIASGAVIRVKHEQGLHKTWRLGQRRWGALGLEACDQVPGCRQDALAAGLYGASSMRAVWHQATGGSVLLVSNYHDGSVREVNSSVWYTDAATARPTLVQTFPTAAAMDVDLLPALPVRRGCGAGGLCLRETDGEMPARSLVAVANFHGPSVVYRWMGALPVRAVRIDTAGANYPESGRIVALGGGFRRSVVGNFMAVGGAVIQVELTSDVAFLPGLRLQAEYHSERACPTDEEACEATPIAGSVVNVSFRSNAWLTCNSTILAAQGGLMVRAWKNYNATSAASPGGVVDGVWQAEILNSSTHGSGYASLEDVVLMDAGRNGTCECVINSTNISNATSMTECIVMTLVRHEALLTALPHGEGAPGIDGIHVAIPGEGYGRGIVRPVGDAGERGSGFRGLVHAYAGGSVSPEGGGYYTGGISHGIVDVGGNGYLPDTELDIFYGPLCARLDAECENVRMQGSVTAVQQQWAADAGRVVNCSAEGSITALPHPEGGAGFKARFHNLPSGGMAVWFDRATEHGGGYVGGLGILQPVVSRDSGCLCQRSVANTSGPAGRNVSTVADSNFSACLRLVVAHGARIEPVPQNLMRADYCLDGDESAPLDPAVPPKCRDVPNRKAVHPWIRADAPRAFVGVDVTRPWLLPTQGAVALAPLLLWNESFLVVACYSPGKASMSKIFRAAQVPANHSTSLNAPRASLNMEDVQTIHTHGARDVGVFYDPWTGDALMLFAQRGTRGSNLFRWRTGARLPSRVGSLPPVEHVQTIVTHEPIRISSAEKAGTVYVSIAQAEPANSSLVMRWNGSHLLGTVNLTTLPKDVAGGSIAASSGGRAMAMWEANGASWLFMSNGLNTTAKRRSGQNAGQCDIKPCGLQSDGSPIECHGGGTGGCGGVPAGGSTSRTEVWSSLYRISYEAPLDMRRPSALVVSPDGRMVYVGAYLSQSINCFLRELPFGELEWRPAASYSFNVPNPTHSDKFEAPWPEDGSMRRPLEGLSAMAMTADGRVLLAAAASEGALYVFTRNMTGGELELLQVLRDGDGLPDGRLVDCLGGASAIAVAGKRAFVTASEDHCLSVFELIESSSGNYSGVAYVERLRERERMIDRFEARAVLNASNESWANSSEPRKLGGGRLPWADRSKVSVSFHIDGELFLAVAAASGDADGNGTLGVFKWSREDMEFVLHQILSRDHNPSDVEFTEQLPLSSSPPGTLSKNLLVVSNLGRGKDAPADPSSTPINVYLFDRSAGEFVWYQRLSVELPDGRQLPPFSTQSSSLAACAPNPRLRLPRAPSLVYKATGFWDACNKSADPRAESTPSPILANGTNSTTAPAPGWTATANTTTTTQATTTPAPPVNYVYESDFLRVPEYSCVPEGLVQSIKVWSKGTFTYLAAAYLWDQPLTETYRWYSVIWRWNRDGFVVLEDGQRVDGFGFEIFQLIDTDAATDVEVLHVPESAQGQEALLVVFSNLFRKSHVEDYNAASPVYRFEDGAWNPLVRGFAGYFVLVQTLPTVGAMSLKAMTVANNYEVGKGGQVKEDDTYLLGVAGNSSIAWAPAAAASRVSNVYRWDAQKELLQLHQVLEPEMRVSSMHVVQQGRETYVILTSFSDVQCKNVSVVAEEVLLGNTSNASNASNPSNARAASGGHVTAADSTPSPYSSGRAATVLQWDRTTKRLDRLMALTDTDSIDTLGIPVPAAERRIHDATLLLAVEDAVHAEAVATSQDLVLLAVSSLTQGLLMYEWRFSKVTGLYGASALVVDADGSRAFVAGAGSDALSLLSLEVRLFVCLVILILVAHAVKGCYAGQKSFV